MIFADTGYFVALTEPRDGLHDRAVRWSRTIKEQVLVTEYVAWELVNALSDPNDRPKAHFWIEQFFTKPGFEFVPASMPIFQAGRELHAARPDKAWSLTDCTSFVVMKDWGLTRALSFDHHFEQAGFEALLRRDP